MDTLLTKNLSKKTIKELVAMRNTLKRDLYTLRINLSLRSLEKTHHIRIVRKNIAKINTVITSIVS